MAQGDPVSVGTQSWTFLLTAETGVIIQSGDRAVDSKRRDVFNAATGYTMGHVFFDFVATQDFSAVVNGVTGLTLAAPGVALSQANDLGIGTNKNGVSAGGTYTTSVRISHQGEDVRMISGTTIQHQNVT